MAYSATWHRAKRRPTTPQPQIGVILDLMLQHAIGPCQRRGLVSSNRSFTPDKMLSVQRRRPASRRQLTEAMLSSQYQPLWWFELLGDKKEWRWQAPSTPQERRENEQKVSRVDRLVAWLEQSDLDKPFLEPPSHTIEQGAEKAIEAVAEDTPVAPIQLKAEGLVSHIESIEHAILSWSDQDALLTAVAAHCEVLENCILSGQFASSELDAALTALEASIVNSPDLGSHRVAHSQHILSTMIEAVCSLCPTQTGSQDMSSQLEELYQTSMNVVLRKISTTSGALKDVMFSYLANNLHPQDIVLKQEVQSETLLRIVKDVVDHYAVTYLSEKQCINIGPSWIRSLADLSDDVRQLPEHLREKIAMGTIDVIYDASTTRKCAFVWLFLSARCEFFTDGNYGSLVRLFKATKDVRDGHLTPAETVSLVLERLVGLHELDHEQRLTMAHDLKDIEHPAFLWGPILKMLGSKDPENSRQVLLKVMDWLHDWKEGRRLHFAVLGMQLGHGDQGLADRARTAMRILLGSSEVRRDHCLSECEVLAHILHSYVSSRRKLENPETDLSPHMDWRRLPEVLEAISESFVNNESLTDRQALRGVEWCLHQSERHYNNRVGSEMILRDLATVMIRKLKKGKTISPFRQSFLIDKVARYQNQEEAEKVQKQLDQWTAYIKHTGFRQPRRLEAPCTK